MTAAQWFRLAVGAVLTVGPLVVLFTALDPIWNGHPAYPATLLVAAAAGLVLVASAFWTRGRPADLPTGRTPADLPAASPARARRVLRVTGRVVLAVLVVGLVAALFWLRPFAAGSASMSLLAGGTGSDPAGTAPSTAAPGEPAAVTVVDGPTSIELVPARPTGKGLVFVPGARVDPRAYAEVLWPVAAAGHLVVIVKPPFGMAIAQTGQPGTAIEAHPEVTTWAVGGHSLGGVVASWYAQDHPDQVDGLLLFGSYSDRDLSGTDLVVESVWGSNDGLTTPEDIERTRTNLPPSAGFTEIVGGVHAYFGDYGEQPGDGQPGIDRAAATEQISAAAVDFMQALPAGSG
ncbi:alpha/beta hydrolase [Nakamurella sp.]|uniref:alpha/beta hydrolase n=1 Tax=Nakamurella sp. TaxID=1869182 RepID=UPI003B3A2E82